MATSTMGVTLKWGPSGSLVKEVSIKDIPDVGGAPSNLDASTFDNTQEVFIKGVEDVGSLSFLANYDPGKYDDILDEEGTGLHFELAFPDGGKWTWEGEIGVELVGAGVDAVLDMRISSVPTTEISFS